MTQPIDQQNFRVGAILAVIAFTVAMAAAMWANTTNSQNIEHRLTCVAEVSEFYSAIEARHACSEQE